MVKCKKLFWVPVRGGCGETLLASGNTPEKIEKEINTHGFNTNEIEQYGFIHYDDKIFVSGNLEEVKSLEELDGAFTNEKLKKRGICPLPEK